MPPKLGQMVETILQTFSVPELVQWYRNTLCITPFVQAASLAGFSYQTTLCSYHLIEAQP